MADKKKDKAASGSRTDKHVHTESGSTADRHARTESGSSDLYSLKTDAVDRLVNASAETAPEVSEEEIAAVSGRRRKWRIPDTVKALFIKWWFNGAICFFFYFGLGTYITAQLDLLFVFGVALGVLTDLLTNNLLRFISRTEGSNDRFMMVTARKFWSIFVNVPYAFLVLYCVVFLYNIINYAIVSVRGVEDSVALGVEPLLFGVFYLGFDMLFIAMKHLFARIVSDARRAAS